MATVKCPICGCEGEAGTFCENCGPTAGRLCAPEPEPVQQEPACPEPALVALPPEPAPLPSLPSLEPQIASLPELRPITPFGSAVGVPLSKQPSGRPPPVEVPDGMPFGAQVTFSETMWVGVASLVKIAFKAARDIYADVSVSVLNGDEELYHRAHGCRPFQHEISFSFNVRPRMPGTSIELTVRFACNRDGSEEPDVFEAFFPICVYEEQAHHINIDASTVVNGTGASVLQYKNSIGDGISIKDRRFGPTQNVTLPLEVSLAATPFRLTLEREGEMIHLWALKANETVVCGRNDSCDYMLRVFDKETGAIDKDKSLVISGAHFRFVIAGGRTLRVMDGVERPSSWGTSIGETGGIGKEGVVLREGRYGIDLGTRYTPHGALSPDVDVTRNGDDESLAGFSITRGDGLNERVVAIVSRTVPFEGGAFAWDGKRFLFNGKKIIPGVSVEVDGKSYEVRTFHQRKK